MTSLESKRKEKQKQSRKSYLSTEERFRELEEDTLRLIDLCLELEATVETQSKALKLLIRNIPTTRK